MDARSTCRIAFIGPPGAGKTAFVGAVLQSLSDSGLNLNAINSAATGAHRSLATALRRCTALDATLETAQYDFGLAAPTPGIWRRAYRRVRRRPLDAPHQPVTLVEIAGHQLPELVLGGHDNALAEVKACDVLALLLPADQPAARAAMYDLMPDLLRALGSDGRPPLAGFHRVLILTTRVDRLACGFIDRSHRIRGVGGAPGRTALDIVRSIDPVRQVGDSMGRQLIDWLLRALPARRPIAAGVAVATGFDALAGFPLGIPSIRLDCDDMNDGFGARWRPYGVDDALRFLIHGHICGAVRALDG